MTGPKPSKGRAIGLTVFLGLIGSVWTVLNAMFSYAIFFLILFMFGLGGGTDAYIANLTRIAGAVGILFFAVSTVLVFMILSRLYRRFQK